MPFIFFDLDGTLVDSAPDIARALNATLAEVGAPPLPVAQVIGYVGDGARALVQRAVPPEAVARTPLDQLVARFAEHYAAGVCIDTRPYPGVVEALARLADAGATLAVLTNKPGRLARTLLQALDLTGFFADVVGDGDGWPRKPAPDAARQLLARHAATATVALVVGDGLPDLRLGRVLGAQTVAAVWGYTSRAALEAEAPTFIAETPADLLTLPPLAGRLERG